MIDISPAALSAVAAYAAGLQQRRAMEAEMTISVATLYGFGVVGPTLYPGRLTTIMGLRVVDPCSYCGRTHQSAHHRTCDGCGAPIKSRSKP